MDNEVFEKEIVERIRLLRKQAGISEEQMGEIIGYNAKVVSAIETGNRPIGLKTLIKWADAVGKELIIDFV
ncbi:helix-turn-helix domain-containing protein [Dyadobacter alkalitolerans]|uniref:helix-turn-helix domain-containing protein n=1 Tax=Dyadobacter alkalitolerans TaxID=492736 RepID=UPI0003FAB155|nr:helix-turn-helix transcriptional regulator [Dyadobacter alkalitolerans]